MQEATMDLVETLPPYVLWQKTTLKVLAFRARTLKITPAEIAACKTLDALKKLARKKYHTLARQYHPDYLLAHEVWYTRNQARAQPGFDFRRVTKTYKWFMALQEKDLVRKSMYPTIQEYILPWHMERMPLHLPTGFNESFDHLAYQ